MLGGAIAALAPIVGAGAVDAAPASARLETKLFNFRDDVSSGKTVEIVAMMKDFARSAGVDGFMIGRNFIPDPFPARFEWIYMVQFDPVATTASSASYRRFADLRAGLSSHCRNEVDCDWFAPIPPRFADAAEVKVRHTVMFNFRPDATPEDQARNVDAIRGMGHLPMVGAYHVERNTAYPSGPTAMKWQVIGDFASVEDYRAYSRAPVHLAIRDDFQAHTSRVAFLDVAL